MRMNNNAVLVTGATSGIGRAFAEQFAARGNTVIACGRRQDRLEELSRRFPSIVTRQCDLSVASERESLAAWATAAHPGLNVLINNAGIQLVADLTKPVELSRIELEIDTNLVAPIQLASLFAPHLSKQSEAAIVNISSGLAFSPIAFMPIYCATKAAIHSFTLSLRHQLRHTSVKVFEIAPPAVDTELGADRRSDPAESHGGMPVDEFIDAAMSAIENDAFETAVGPAEGMRKMREELFERMNGGR